LDDKSGAWKMKNLHVTFDDAEFRHLTKHKDELGLAWREFLLHLHNTAKGAK